MEQRVFSWEMGSLILHVQPVHSSLTYCLLTFRKRDVQGLHWRDFVFVHTNVHKQKTHTQHKPVMLVKTPDLVKWTRSRYDCSLLVQKDSPLSSQPLKLSSSAKYRSSVALIYTAGCYWIMKLIDAQIEKCASFIFKLAVNEFSVTQFWLSSFYYSFS